MKLVTVVGARPQFIKAAAISRALDRVGGNMVEHVLVHTGQHYDTGMSQVFFDELELAEPKYHLGIGGLNHGAMTGRMLEAIEAVLEDECPSWTLVYGDTNSTMAGALAATKLQIPLAHVEAGLRSYNRRMPEEVNRIVADHVSTLLFCPTDQAVKNLEAEGVVKGVHQVGDVMYDSALFYREKALERYSLAEWGVRDGEYVLCTIHRAENTDDRNRLVGILEALAEIGGSISVVLPLHPRTRNRLDLWGLDSLLVGIHLVEPVSYLAMTRLELSAAVILTDSGGVQKEAFFHGVPCLTLRKETEWAETVECGWNVVAGVDRDGILSGWNALDGLERRYKRPYGMGDAAQHIVRHLLELR